MWESYEEKRIIHNYLYLYDDIAVGISTLNEVQLQRLVEKSISRSSEN